MFPITFWLPGLCLVLNAVAASSFVVKRSVISLPLSKRMNFSGTHNLIKADQARARALRTRANAIANGAHIFDSNAVINEAVVNAALTYLAEVNVGTPPSTYMLVIDTGSANTWVGANQQKPYRNTSSSVDTGDQVAVSYGSGSFNGEQFLDFVDLGGGLVVRNQSIGGATRAAGFDGVDGILGIGPVDLTTGTLWPDINAIIPTVTDNLFQQGVISKNVIGISYNPTNVPEQQNGVLTWGGVDASKFTGSINYAPITTTAPAKFYWAVDQSIRYGTSHPILRSGAGVIDTGTTLILLATDAFNRYQAATGAIKDKNTGLLRLSTAQFANLKSLFFHIGSVTYELIPNAQIWPRALNTDIGGDSNHVYLIVGDLGIPSGEGLDFINGFTFLERFYSVYDTTNRRVGFATTPNTYSTIN